MCAYNKVNGTYASQHRWLLTEMLREEWGFDGLVVSDWGAVQDRVAALAAGLDLEMPPNLGVSNAAIAAAVRAGELDEAGFEIEGSALSNALGGKDQVGRRCQASATSGQLRSSPVSCSGSSL
jgi:beta-glucosidase